MAREFNCLEHCPDLGHCCRDFSIYHDGLKVGKKITREGVEKYLKEKKLPFEVLYLNEKSGMWALACHNLGSEGRCADYENRPQLCRDFRPRSEQPLCCAPKLTIGERLGDLAASLMNKIKMTGMLRPSAQ